MAKDKKVLIRIDNLKQYFPVKKSSLLSRETLYVRANDDVSLEIYEGETFGLVGESGCGKSTLGRSLLQLYKQTAGRTLYYGRPLHEVNPDYVLDTLEKLPSLKKKLVELQKKEEDSKAKYEALPEGDEKYSALETLRKDSAESRKAYLSLVQLIGAFILADDLAPVSDILTKEYNTAAKMYKNKDNKIELQKLEKEMKDIQAKIETMLDKYRDNPKFDEYQKQKDGGIDLTKLTEEEMRGLRKDLQLIFQDPYSSLNPRLTVGQIVSEGLYTHDIFKKGDQEIQDYVLETMENCGLAPYFIHRYPHQFSGGQRQRIGIARAVALKPKFIVCDEAVSALDVSIQSQIINLLLDLKEKEDLTYLFISHDLSVIKYISDRVGVMYLGNIVELAETKELYARPMHPYTEALLSAIPTTDVRRERSTDILEGDIPSPINPPSGCKFHTRCKYATNICRQVVPEFEEARPGHFVACHHKLNVD
ncbi:MAG: ATP-binding cassette domain-containing protein [Tissierellaceae bacterium]|nr:ATP-binding cassette domain-containing protein [Tissierellaceae bacterium]